MVAQLRAGNGAPFSLQSTTLEAPAGRRPSDDSVRVTVLIPAKNEAGNIAWVLRGMPPSVDEVVLVDGKSTDRTVEIARAIRPNIVVLSEPARGKGSAMRAGFAVARGRWVVVMDADGSMDPADIDAYVAALEGGADLVKGSRYMQGGGSTDLTVVRSLGNRALLTLSNLLYRQQFTELCYGFFALRASRIDELRLQATGFEIETEVVCRSVRQGFTIREIPSHESPRISGESNLHPFRDGARILNTMMRAAFRTPSQRTSNKRARYVQMPQPSAEFEVLFRDGHRVPAPSAFLIED